MYLFEDKMRIDLPEDFRYLSKEEIKMLFHEKEKPQIVMEGIRGEHIAFSLTDKMVESIQLESIRNDLLPSNNLVWMDFQGNTISAKRYYVLFSTIISGKLLIGLFQCNWNQMGDQKYNILQVLKSIIDVRNAKC